MQGVLQPAGEASAFQDGCPGRLAAADAPSDHLPQRCAWYCVCSRFEHSWSAFRCLSLAQLPGFGLFKLQPSLLPTSCAAHADNFIWLACGALLQAEHDLCTAVELHSALLDVAIALCLLAKAAAQSNPLHTLALALILTCAAVEFHSASLDVAMATALCLLAEAAAQSDPLHTLALKLEAPPTATLRASLLRVLAALAACVQRSPSLR